MKKIMKIIIPLILIVFLLTISILITDNNKYKDTITYKGKTYELLEHNMDIFTYFYNSNTYLEEDKIHKVSHNKWDILYFNGDLFVLDKQVKKTTKYYQDDKNYNWFITYERDDLLIEKEIDLTKKELDYLYNIESIKKEQTMTFDDIKQFVDIEKVSKDNLIKGRTNFVNYQDSFYWKTEIMTDDDREYIIKLPESINNKIFSLID